MLAGLFSLEGKAGEHLPQPRNETPDLHTFKSDGKKQPHAAQQKNQQIIPEKALDGFYELGDPFHSGPALPAFPPLTAADSAFQYTTREKPGQDFSLVFYQSGSN